MLDPVKDDVLPDPDVIRLEHLSILCTNYNVLPRQGSLLDQDAIEIIGMNYAQAALRDKEEEESKKPSGKKKKARR